MECTCHIKGDVPGNDGKWSCEVHCPGCGGTDKVYCDRCRDLHCTNKECEYYFE